MFKRKGKKPKSYDWYFKFSGEYAGKEVVFYKYITLGSKVMNMYLLNKVIDNVREIEKLQTLNVDFYAFLGRNVSKV